MSNRPSNIQRYIKLVVGEPLDKELMTAWFQCVKTTAPSGVLGSVQTTDESGALRGASMVHREIGGKHVYIIPLLRDLSDAEVEPAVALFTEKSGDLNFDVEVSSSETDDLRAPQSVDITDDSYNALCAAWAKKQHEDWLKERTESGWRYGLTMSTKNKTHPLLRPWHDLPDQYRKVDLEQPQSLLDLLNDQGYAVISKAELEGIMSLLRRKGR